MFYNVLKLDNDKTEVMVFGPMKHREPAIQTHASHDYQCTTETINLGRMVDSELFKTF